MRERKDIEKDLAQARANLEAVTTREGATAEEIRTATEAVQRLTAELNAKIVEIAAEKAQAEAQQRSNDRSLNQLNQRFSMVKFIRQSMPGQVMDGAEEEVRQMGVQEARTLGLNITGSYIPLAIMEGRAFTGQNATTPGDGGHLIESELKYQEELRKRMVLSSMGTQVIGGLTGNITLVKGKPVSASWEQENSAVAVQKKAFSSESISPKRLAMQMGISKQLLIQSSLDVERMVMNNILAAHSEALEDAAVNGDGSSNKPTGILNVSGTKTVELGTDGKIPTFADMVFMETELASLNADLGRLAYLTNPKVRGLFKTTLMSTGVGGYVWQNNEVNGFPAYASNFVPSNLTKGSASEKCSAIVFGNWNDLQILGWGGMDIIVDPYTLADEGAVRIIMNTFHNVFVPRPESFVLIKDALVTA